MRGWKKTLTIDADNPVVGDLHLTGGDLSIVDGDDATAQEIRSRLLLFKGSNFVDLREGIPYYQEILAKGIAPARVRSLLRQAILSHPAVVDVPSLTVSIDRATRSATVTFEARTVEGTVVSSVDFGAVEVG